MHVHGFHIVSEPSGQPYAYDADEKLIHDGHLTTITNAAGEIRGPFQTVKEGVDCAYKWRAEEAAAKLKAIEDAAPNASQTGMSVPPETNTVGDEPKAEESET